MILLLLLILIYNNNIIITVNNNNNVINNININLSYNISRRFLYVYIFFPILSFVIIKYEKFEF